MALLTRLRCGVEARLRRLGANYHDAEDAVSDAILALYEAALAGTWRSAPNEWARALFRKARTCLFQARRRMQIEQRHGSERARTAGDTARFDPETPEVGHLLKCLTPRERQVVMARASGHSYRTIAESGETTAGAAKTHFANAKAKLRALDRRRSAA